MLALLAVFAASAVLHVIDVVPVGLVPVLAVVPYLI